MRPTTLLCCLALAACNAGDIGDPGISCPTTYKPPDADARVTIPQGVSGKVMLWEGDFMPGTPHRGTITPVARTVLVYESTPESMVEHPQPLRLTAWFSRVRTQLVDSTRSDTTGFYQLTLRQGSYSLFVRVDSLLYANGWDNSTGAMVVQPVTVPNCSVVTRQLNLDWNKTW